MKAIKKLNYFLLVILCLFIFNSNVFAKETSATCVYKVNSKCELKITVKGNDKPTVATQEVKSGDKTSACYVENELGDSVKSIKAFTNIGFKDTTKKVWKCPSEISYRKLDDVPAANFAGTITKYVVRGLDASKQESAKLNKSKSSDGEKYSDNSGNKDEVYYCKYENNLILEVNVKKKEVKFTNKPEVGACNRDFSYDAMMNSENLNRNKCPLSVYGCTDTSSYASINETCKYYLAKAGGLACNELKLIDDNVTDANGDSANKNHESKKTIDDTGYCGFIGPRTLKMIKWGIKLIRIGAPILIIIFGIMDFINAMFGGEDKTLKESLSKFIKRLIAGVILLFVPYILIFMVKLSGVADDVDIDVDDMFCAVINE